MLALVSKRNFYGIIGDETSKMVNGESVCIGDTVRVASGSNHNECVGVVGIFTDKISVMGLGSTPLSELEIIEIVDSHKLIKGNYKFHNVYFEAKEFQE